MFQSIFQCFNPFPDFNPLFLMFNNFKIMLNLNSENKIKGKISVKTKIFTFNPSDSKNAIKFICMVKLRMAIFV